MTDPGPPGPGEDEERREGPVAAGGGSPSKADARRPLPPEPSPMANTERSSEPVRPAGADADRAATDGREPARGVRAAEGDGTSGPGPAAGRRPSGAELVAIVALVVAAVAYSSWVLAGWLNPPLNSVDAYASELAATDQPWSGLFRSGDVVAGAAAVLAGLIVARRRPWLGWACVTAFGVFTAMDSGLFPMTCAPSVDAACAAAEAAGTVPLRHQIHTFSSSLAAAAALLGLVVAAWTWHTVAAWALCELMIVATVGTIAAVAADRFVGLGQRFQLLVVAAWLLWLGLRLLRGGANAARG